MYDRDGKLKDDESPADDEVALLVLCVGLACDAMLELPY
jgi:hypothetical protein